jgi:hypothetical protein
MTKATKAVRTAEVQITRRLELRKPCSIGVDTRVQRELDQARVRELVRNWDDNALDVPKVSQRAGGECIWLDGQHRGAALIQMGRGEVSIECLVYRGLSLQEEAALFRRLNNSKRLSPIDLYRVALTEKDATAWKCQMLLDAVRLEVGQGRKNSFTAVNTLWRMVERDAVSAERALTLLTLAWGPVREAVEGRLLQGVGDWMLRHGESVVIKAFGDKVAKTTGTPGAFLGQAKALSQMLNISVPDAVADKLTNVYNHNRRTGLLPAWRQ